MLNADRGIRRRSMPMTAAERVTAIKEAIDVKLTGGAVRAITFPDGKNLQHMTLAELHEALKFWEAEAYTEEHPEAGQRTLRFSKIRLGETP
jgi:hypothetical protein